MRSHVVEYTGKDGKARCSIIHDDTLKNAESFEAWAAWNGYKIGSGLTLRGKSQIESAKIIRSIRGFA